MSTKTLIMDWDLNPLYSSFKGEDFLKDISLLDEEINFLNSWGENNLNDKKDAALKLEEYINMIRDYRNLSSRLSSFASLSTAANGKDDIAKKYSSIISKKSTSLTEFHVKFSKWLSSIENLNEVINSSSLLKEHEFYLNEIVKSSKYILGEKEEAIISKMKLTGSTSWVNLRSQLTANHTVDIIINDKTETLGINKVKNMLFSKDEETRKNAFYSERKSNEKIAESIAAALNGIKGEVLTTCELKGYKSPLFKTIEDSRMDEETLNTMLKVMEKNLPEFQRYFLKKAQLLGHNGKLPFYDVTAPVGNKDMKFSYEEARDFIVKQFSSFSKEMGNLANKAFENRWIDAKSKEGKRGGAFCSNLHCIKQSRILCSYDNNFKNLCTLSHELGHAYHGMILQKESVLNSSYPMPLAETASIFAENIVRNAALKTADKEEALAILGTELVNSTAVIVDIFARFSFEKEFFEKRKEGDLSLDEIKELMISCEKLAYGDAILEDTFDPYAWIHKVHYYMPERNFYNFPYAFGLLFSKGLYSMYLKEGDTFVNKYNEVLRLTGQHNVYDVAKYVGIDLHKEEFWQSSMDIVISDIDKFCSI